MLVFCCNKLPKLKFLKKSEKKVLTKREKSDRIDKHRTRGDSLSGARNDPWKLNNEEIVQRKYEKEVIKKLKYNQISTIPK